MATNNPLNVFKGPDALAQFFDPDRNPPLPLVELPDALNPMRKDGIRIFAKMLTQLPAQNVKSLPALRMLRNQPKAPHQRIVEASSGSTVLSQAMIARALWGHEDVHAYVTNKKHPDSLKLMRFFGIHVNLYGGLAQQEPYDPKGIMARLRNLSANDPSICYPAQYHNDDNWKSHEQWTGTQIWQQLPEVRVFCSTVGTGGCVVGTGRCLKSKNPEIRVVGVCNAFGDPTPGPRHYPNFESSPFPWRETIDAFEEVPSVESYRTSMRLCRYGIIAGPSSGEALHGLLSYLKKMKAAGRLNELVHPTSGEISCVFVCADLPYQYMDLYYSKLNMDEFPNIRNENLLRVDQDPYDERWFLTPKKAAEAVRRKGHRMEDILCSNMTPCYCGILAAAPPPCTPSPAVSFTSDTSSDSDMSPDWISRYEVAVLDLRPSEKFAVAHVHMSHNIPLVKAKEDFYGDAVALEQRDNEVKLALDGDPWLLKARREDTIVVLCADGESSKLATAKLRACGLKAFCVKGGYSELCKYVVSLGKIDDEGRLRIESLRR